MAGGRRRGCLPLLGMRGARLGLIAGMGVALLVASCGDSGEKPDGGGGAGSGGTESGTITTMVDGGAPAAGTVRIAVPAYYQPGAAWNRLIAAAPKVG